MNLSQSVNRSVNLVGATIAGLAGFAFAPEAIIEPEMIDKVDDSLILLVGIAAIVWYLRNAYTRSVMPIVFVALGLVVKIFAIIVEIADPEDVGDDFGGLILFILGTALVVFLYSRAEALAKSG